MLVCACSESPHPQMNTNSPSVQSALIPKVESSSKKYVSQCVSVPFNLNNEFDNTAMLLAGKELKNREFNKFPYWEMYREFIDISWKKLKQQRLDKITKWREQEIASVDTLTHTVFYPFSGPDFLTVSVLFPKADTFILLGLEPVGALPDFSRMTPDQQQNYLSFFSNSLSDIFGKSYFITRKMLNDFQTQKVNGLLSVLCFFIKKLNYEIADMRYIYKDNTHQIKEMNYHSKSMCKSFGIKITAIKDSCAKTIYYFRYNVTDKFFNDSSTFYHHLAHYHHYATYIKSASYLLHNPFMKNMRQLILKNSVIILQDDTGVPYKYLADTSIWNLRLYGEYDKPVKDFKKMGYQPDLAKKMKEESTRIPKLPFHLGYHWGNKKDVLLFAIKKNKR